MSDNSQSPPERLLYSLNEVSFMIGHTRQKVMDFVNEGKLASFKIGKRKVQFKLEDINNFIDNHRVIYNPKKFQ